METNRLSPASETAPLLVREPPQEKKSIFTRIGEFLGLIKPQAASTLKKHKFTLLDKAHTSYQASNVALLTLGMRIKTGVEDLAHRVLDKIAPRPIQKVNDSGSFISVTHGKYTEYVARHDTGEIPSVKSNAFRVDITVKGFDQAAREIPKEPVNMRTHSLKDGLENVTSFVRMGMITDLRNGFTNLEELKELAGSPSMRERKIEALEKMKVGANQNQLQSIDRAIRDARDPEAAYRERHTLLEHLFLRMLQAQVEDKGELGEELNLVQLSLLNPIKSQLDRSGWMHDEKNAMIDMAEIFREMNGKTIVIGQGGPKVDGDVIYLPKGEALEPTRLNAVFVNMSVQGHTKNDGRQYLINQAAADELRARDPELARLLTQKDSSYRVAEQIAERALKLNGSALTINCASGKDRTGAVCSRLILKSLPKELYESSKDMVFDPNSASARVVKDNTSVVVLKIDPRQVFFFPGVSTAAKARFLWDLSRFPFSPV